MIIFRVDVHRFYFEYTSLLAAQQTDRKYVQWYVDKKLMIHMYIVTDVNSVYYYSVHKNRLSEKFKGVLSPKGVILGLFESFEKGNTNKQLQDIFEATHTVLNEFRLKF